jgi:hypothetical protein
MVSHAIPDRDWTDFCYLGSSSQHQIRQDVLSLGDLAVATAAASAPGQDCGQDEMKTSKPDTDEATRLAAIS